MKQISLFLFLLFIVGTAMAQVPQKFNYQGIARDLQGNPMANQQLGLKLSVLPTSDATEPEYVETQLITTNEFGLYTLQIGSGEVVSGDMKTVKWETGNKYIRVAIDPQGGTNYVDAGTTQLLSVPYAIYADKAGVAREAVTSGGTTRATNNFVEKTSSTGVVNSTSQIYDNGSGVAIGGFTTPVYTLESRKNTNTDWCIRTTNTAGTSRSAFRIQNEDSTLGQIDFTKFGKNYGGTFMGISRNNMAGINSLTGPFVLNCGGDMIFGNSLTVSPFTQTPRMTINGTTGNVGFGLPLGGAAAARVEVNGQIKINGGAPGAGKVLTSDANGLATWEIPGATSGPWTTSLNDIYNNNLGNVGIGTTNPAHKLHVAAGNLFVESSSGLINFGYDGGNQWQLATTGGGADLRWYTTPNGGTTITPRHYFSQNGNVGIGGFSGSQVPIGRLNIIGEGTTSITNNFVCQNSLGDTLVRLRDDGRMGIGYNGSSYGRTINLGGTGINFYKANEAAFGGAIFPTDTSLVIWSNSGANNYLILQPSWGNVGIGTYSPDAKFHVVGNGLFSGTVTASCGTLICSDKRYKKNITPLVNSLDKVNQLIGVNYFLRADEFPDMNFTDSKQIGLIAQEVEKIIPELVITNEKGYKAVDYSKLTPVLIEAIKELKAQNEALVNENKSMTSNMNDVQSKIASLETKLNILLDQSASASTK